MSGKVDPVFESMLRETSIHINSILRKAVELERERIREIVRSHEDDEARYPGVLTDQILDEIGED